MSIQLIQQYHSKVERLIRYGGTRKETTVRKPFMDLLEHYARPRNLELVPEVEYCTRSDFMGMTPNEATLMFSRYTFGLSMMPGLSRSNK